MYMSVMRHGGAWDTVARVFKIKSSSSERLITQFSTMLALYIASVFVDEVANVHIYSELREGKR